MPLTLLNPTFTNFSFDIWPKSECFLITFNNPWLRIPFAVHKLLRHHLLHTAQAESEDCLAATTGRLWCLVPTRPLNILTSIFS